MRKKGKIALAVDANNMNSSALRKTSTLAQNIARQMNSQAEPVYALRPTEFYVPTELAPVPVFVPMDELKAEAVAKFKKLAKKTKLDMPTLKVVPCRGPSITAEIESLNRYLKRNKYQMVIVSSRGKKGFQRFFMGSFTDAALHTLEVPMLIVNPKQQLSSSEIKNIMYATDGSDESFYAFLKLVVLAARLKCSITLLTILPTPTRWARPYVRFNSVRYTKMVLKKFSTWILKAKKKGVIAYVEVVRSEENVVQAIVGVAHKKTDIIALSARSTAAPLATIMGVSHKLVYLAKEPVLILKS
ncbi:MAG: hypothetical protein A2Z20_08710 [Bdellovibrionales bacterium RBG_16_40_8]|nr:MAG: hypothetical protein A2Z20_08710 [Bdellovibrionales bacterium RBG_16_40_8]